MKITCDTDIGEIIKPSDVTSAFSSLSSDIKPILVYSKILKQETSSGRGLSKEALNVNGISYANKETVKQIGNFEDFHAKYSSSKATLIEAAENQRKKELTELRNAVEAKISQLESEIATDQANLAVENNKEIKDNVRIAIIKTNIQSKRQDLDHYEKKLKQVEAALGGA